MGSKYPLSVLFCLSAFSFFLFPFSVLCIILCVSRSRSRLILNFLFRSSRRSIASIGVNRSHYSLTPYSSTSTIPWDEVARSDRLKGPGENIKALSINNSNVLCSVEIDTKSGTTLSVLELRQGAKWERIPLSDTVRSVTYKLAYILCSKYLIHGPIERR